MIPPPPPVMKHFKPPSFSSKVGCGSLWHSGQEQGITTGIFLQAGPPAFWCFAPSPSPVQVETQETNTSVGSGHVQSLRDPSHISSAERGKMPLKRSSGKGIGDVGVATHFQKTCLEHREGMKAQVSSAFPCSTWSCDRKGNASPEHPITQVT